MLCNAVVLRKNRNKFCFCRAAHCITGLSSATWCSYLCWDVNQSLGKPLFTLQPTMSACYWELRHELQQCLWTLSFLQFCACCCSMLYCVDYTSFITVDLVLVFTFVLLIKLHTGNKEEETHCRGQAGKVWQDFRNNTKGNTTRIGNVRILRY